MRDLCTYPAARYMLHTGCVVTFDGNDMLSRAIKFFAPGGSHTAMVLRLKDCQDTILLFESLQHGPTITRMSRRISNYDGQVHISFPYRTVEQEQAIAAMALRLLGARIGYDYPSLFLQIRKRVALNMKRGFCSESVQYILSHAGVLPPQLYAMTPGELRASFGNEITLAPYTVDCEAADVGGV